VAKKGKLVDFKEVKMGKSGGYELTMELDFDGSTWTKSIPGWTPEGKTAISVLKQATIGDDLEVTLEQKGQYWNIAGVENLSVGFGGGSDDYSGVGTGDPPSSARTANTGQFRDPETLSRIDALKCACELTEFDKKATLLEKMATVLIQAQVFYQWTTGRINVDGAVESIAEFDPKNPTPKSAPADNEDADEAPVPGDDDIPF